MTTLNNVTVTPHDGTCEDLAGAQIISAHRDGMWLVITYRNRHGVDRVLNFSGRTTRGAVYCGKCGEEKLVDIVRDKGRPPQAYCTVCSNRWELVG